MWTASKKLAYLKALAALAWADGDLSNQELNYIKTLARKFNLPNQAWRELDPCLEDYIPPDEADGLLKSFLDLIGAPDEKRLLLDSLKEMADADDEISPEEQEFLSKAIRLIKKTSSVKMLTSPFRELFKAAVSSSQKSKEQAQIFARNKILYKLQRRIQQGKLSPVAPERLEYLSLFAGLLARVACVDRDFSAAELDSLKREIVRLGDFNADEVAVITSVVQDTTLKGVDNALLSAGFFNVSDQEQRRQLLECLFALAAADGKISSVETEEIRSIATALGFSHKQFIAAKLAVLKPA